MDDLEKWAKFIQENTIFDFFLKSETQRGGRADEQLIDSAEEDIA